MTSAGRERALPAGSEGDHGPWAGRGGRGLLRAVPPGPAASATGLPPVPRALRAELAWSLGEARAQAWLEEAVAVARSLVGRWRLEPRAVLTGGSMSLCLHCDVRLPAGSTPRSTDRSTGSIGGASEVVLKIPANRVVGRAERAALRAWAGEGAPSLLAEDPGTSAMLMGYLAGTGGGFGVPEVLGLADRLHAAEPLGHDFEPVEANLAQRVACATERFTREAEEGCLADLARAQALLADLLGNARGRRVLLHGDLQTKNLILTAAGLGAVDPLPVLGPAVVDVAFWVAKSGHERPLAARVAEVAAARPEWDRDELAAWVWALAVVEHRPRVPTGTPRRQEFIDALRPRYASS